MNKKELENSLNDEKEIYKIIEQITDKLKETNNLLKELNEYNNIDIIVDYSNDSEYKMKILKLKVTKTYNINEE